MELRVETHHYGRLVRAMVLGHTAISDPSFSAVSRHLPTVSRHQHPRSLTASEQLRLTPSLRRTLAALCSARHVTAARGRLNLDSAHSRQRRFSRRSGIGRKLATHKNEVCLLPKQLGEQVAKLQVRALWEREFMALVRAHVKALDFKLWISRGIMVL